MKYQVINNEARNRFEVELNGEYAFIDYKMQAEDVIALNHTEVPESMEGQGIASVLAEHVFEYIKANHMKVKPYCSFIKVYLQRHPEYNELLA